MTDPTLEFLRDALKDEWSTDAGRLNLIGIGVVALIAAADSLLEFIFKCLQLLVFALDRIAQAITGRQSFRPMEMPQLTDRIQAYLLIATAALACVVVVGAVTQDLSA